MEAAFGADFSSIRIHDDDPAHNAARALGARAFSNGENLVFAGGRYAPGRSEGARLLAHELAHALQTRAARTMPTRAGEGSPSLATREVAEAQADRMAANVLARARISEPPLPVLGPHLDKAAPGELDVEAEILAVLNTPVGAEDRVAQRQRIDRLTGIFTNLPFWQAEQLAARLAKPTPSDRLARAFHYRLSTATREILLGRLRGQAASTAGLTSEYEPRSDPRYIDKVITQVQCMLIVADRYTLVWNGGRKLIFNANIDWTGATKALPILTVYRDEASAKAASAEWDDVAVRTGHDRAVAYYRGEGGAILPTWFSPEITPETYQLIMGVNGKVRQEAAAAESFFRGLRNGMVVGMILGGVLRFVVRWPGGAGARGGGEPAIPESGPTRPPATETEIPGGRAGEPGAARPSVAEEGASAESTATSTRPRMQEPIREMESGQPIEFGPRHAEALRQNAQAATEKWLKILDTQGRVPWDSVRAQMGLSRWRFLPRAPEAAAILRNALSRLPAGPERTEMLEMLERWLTGRAP